MTKPKLDKYKALNKRPIPWSEALTWAVLLVLILCAATAYTFTLRTLMQDAHRAGIVAGVTLRDAQTGPLLYRLREIEMGHQRQIWAGDSLIGWWPVEGQ